VDPSSECKAATLGPAPGGPPAADAAADENASELLERDTSLRFAVALLALAIAPGSAALDVPPEAPIVDLAGLLRPETIRELHQSVLEYEARTGHQFAVLVIPALEGEVLEDYSLRVAQAWNLGYEQRDDGLLLLISVADRQARIEVGHGLEGAITDALSARILRETLGPALAGGDADAGLRESLARLMRAAERESVGRRVDSGIPFFFFVLLWIAILWIAIRLERARRSALEDHHRWDTARGRRQHVWIEPTGWGSLPGARSPGGVVAGRGFGAGGGSFGGGGASGSW